jgi:hypothetical protein
VIGNRERLVRAPPPVPAQPAGQGRDVRRYWRLMRYLMLSADYPRVSIRAEDAGPVEPAELGLPTHLLDELDAWNDRYRPVIPADHEARRSEPLASLIEELDRCGLSLADQVAAAIGAGSKVAYYSEGLLQRLSP